MPAKPYATSPLAQLIARRVLELRPKKTRVEIAAEAGFTNPNMVTMLKTGANKVPLDRVPGLARALETDPRHLFLLAFEQEGGETLLRALGEVFGTVVTRNELAWIEALREASGRTDPGLTTRARTALFAIFGR